MRANWRALARLWISNAVVGAMVGQERLIAEARQRVNHQDPIDSGIEPGWFVAHTWCGM